MVVVVAAVLRRRRAYAMLAQLRYYRSGFGGATSFSPPNYACCCCHTRVVLMRLTFRHLHPEPTARNLPTHYLHILPIFERSSFSKTETDATASTN